MQQNRKLLKTHFVTNKIPTQEDFYNFIESVLIQEEDGILKPDGGPIALLAQGAQQEVLHFYKGSFDPGQVPVWKINLNPASASGTGLNIYTTAATTDTSRLFIKDDGNVGIGTTTPTARLDVNGMLKATIVQPSAGNTATNGILFPGNPAGGTEDAAWIRYYATTGSATNDQTTLEIGTSNDPQDHIALMPSGNVGINTRNPGAKLDVNGTVNVSGTLTATKFTGDGSGLTNIANMVALGGDQTIGGVKTFSSNVVVNGKVGVGTSNPQALLDVGKYADATTVGGNAVGTLAAVLGRLQEGNDRAEGTFLGVRGYETQPAGKFNGKSFGLEHSFYGVVNSSINFFRGPNMGGGFIAFNTGINVEQVRINGNGLVGIGTTDPAAKLDVNGMLKATIIQPSLGNTATNGILFPGNPAGGTEDAAWIRYYATTGSATDDQTTLEIGTSNDPQDHIALMPSGNVGIGTRSPVAKLDVYGFSRVDYGPYAYLTNAPLIVTGTYPRTNIPISIKASDRIVATEFDASSDARIKKDIAGSDASANLKKLNQLAVTDFCYKDEIQCGTSTQIGFIAQEVEKVMPEAVSTHPDFVPDVYALSSSASLNGTVLTVTMKDDHGLHAGDTVRLIIASGAKEVSVLSANEKTFEIPDWKENVDNVFVYGKKVTDFRTVNYNSIFSLGISAIQELYKQLQQLKEELSEVTGKFMGRLAAD